MDDYVPAKEAAREIGIEYPALMARVRRNTVTAKRIGWAVLIHKDEIARVRANVNRNKNLETTAG